MSWRDKPSFYSLKVEPHIYINSEDEHFEYMNLNPKGEIEGDHIFQVIKFLNPQATDEEVVNIIVDEQIRTASMSFESNGVKRLIDKLFGYEFIKTEKRHTVRDFIKEWEQGKFKGWIIVKMGKRLEMFNADDGKFYGCHLITWANKVTGYWIVGDVDEKDT